MLILQYKTSQVDEWSGYPYYKSYSSVGYGYTGVNTLEAAKAQIENDYPNYPLTYRVLVNQPPLTNIGSFESYNPIATLFYANDQPTHGPISTSFYQGCSNAIGLTPQSDDIVLLTNPASDTVALGRLWHYPDSSCFSPYPSGWDPNIEDGMVLNNCTIFDSCGGYYPVFLVKRLPKIYVLN